MPENLDREVTARELAKLVEESYATIDHWSDQGLLVFRIVGRKRYYPQAENVFRCRKIRDYQNERILIPNMKPLLAQEVRRRFG